MGAGLTLLAVAGLVGWRVAGAGSGGNAAATHAGERASRGGASGRPDGPAHVLVSQTGRLPAAVQDAAVAVAADGRGALLIGGLDSSEASVSDVLHVQSSASASTRLSSLPIAVHDACASATGGAVYLFGGGQLTSFSQILRVGSAGGGTPAGSLPTSASDVGCATVGGTVYVVGGYTGSEPLRTIVAWRPGATARVVGVLPKPLRYAAVAADGGQLVIAGGTSGEQASRDVYRFYPTGGRVELLAQLPHPVTHAAAAALGGVVLVIGGRSTSPSGQTPRILAISPAGAVSVAGALPRALSDLAAVRMGEAVMLAGGRDSAGNAQSAILAVTPKR